MRPSWLGGFCVLAAVAASRAASAATLGPGDLLLVVNKNVPESADLAKHYADVRHVPAERILTLDVSRDEDVSPEAYDVTIADPVRQYLQSPAGSGVKCVVLFYGLPIHVSQRVSVPADRAELTQLHKLDDAINQRLPDLADRLELIAADVGAKPIGDRGKTPAACFRRIEIAARQIEEGQANVIGADPRAALQQKLQAFKDAAVVAAVEAMSAAGFNVPRVNEVVDPRPALAKPRDAHSRDTARGMLTRIGGAIQLGKLVQAQISWLSGEESDASIDSELSLVLAGDHPYYRWMPNPLNLHQGGSGLNVVMVSRIDGPTPEIARRIIDESAAVEKVGLEGKCVIDSRGLPTSAELGTYGWYDQLLRQTAAFVKAKTPLDLVADDKAQVILPGTVRGAGLYCGWYSLRQYIASCSYVPGAVGYHVASLEMVSLHMPGEKGWVANLLKDGVDATLGAVSEPYLNSFPQPQEFFPLLMTGKLSLAEVYWATCPMTSWKITLIGDPLYRPFAAKPALKTDDLPLDLKQFAEKSAAAGAGGR